MVQLSTVPACVVSGLGCTQPVSGVCARGCVQFFHDPSLQRWPPAEPYIDAFVRRYCDTIMKACGELDDELAERLEVAVANAAGEAVEGASQVVDRLFGFATYWVRGVARPFPVRVHRMRSQIGMCVWPATFTMVDFFATRPGEVGVGGDIVSDWVCFHFLILSTCCGAWGVVHGRMGDLLAGCRGQSC